MNHRIRIATCLLSAIVSLSAVAAEQMKIGTPDLQSVGPLAFSSDGILFVGDPKGAAIFAIDTRDTSGNPNQAEFQIEGVDRQVAALLGTTPDEVPINDLAVNPASGAVYLSVSRGRGPDAVPVIIRIGSQGTLSHFALDEVAFSKASLPNAPEDRAVGEGRRRRNQRMESITDLVYLDGRLYVAGLSNEEFASKMRSIPFPFEPADEGASIEIYHGAHGQYETRSPVRTFAAYDIDEVSHLLAAYTCTPLVKIPIDMLRSGEKVIGETVAELGNRNRPLDMIVYEKDGADYVLMANTSRGVMKISLAGISDVTSIAERISGVAGLPYETIDTLSGVMQLDRLNKEKVVLLVQSDGGGFNLSTIVLP